MTEFTFGPYQLLVDVERTRAYYQTHPLPWVTCDCAGCRNFVQATKQLPPDDFPHPCFQTNVLWDALPWMLKEPNPYVEE